MLEDKLENSLGEEPLAETEAPSSVEESGEELVVEEPFSAPADAAAAPEPEAPLAEDTVEAVSSEELPEEERVPESGGDSTDPLSLDPVNPKMKWYVVHTYSGHENKVRTNLLRRVLLEDMEDRIGRILVPTEEVTEMKMGKKTTSTKKYFPGYILVEMEMGDQAFHLVTDISGVTGFVGQDPRDSSRRPTPLRPPEVNRVLGRIERPQEHTTTEIPYSVGDHVKVIDGPFSEFNGVVDEVNRERGTLKVMVSIFGRETPVQLDFLQVEQL
ncbi:MAG: transcription termination/antitermination protein NusG [Candidatus Krumholzibacteria bacterium]|jgi:transcriptional antiterminator NusG|nr:transcription termination/antitermination protein NusG [Candidatus Krumholzibacteria bacterium]